MRKVLGPLAPLVFNQQGHLQCPEPIMRARAALAATPPVRELRPQALPVKLLTVGAFTAAVNVPCGMWREHCEKFSGAWFLAVHASIPFIAMLRKAVIMPKYAILFTIAAAVAGQAMGARLERKRLTGGRLVRLITSPAAPRMALSAPAPAAAGASQQVVRSAPASSPTMSLTDALLTDGTAWKLGRPQGGTQRLRTNSAAGSAVAALPGRSRWSAAAAAPHALALPPPVVSVSA
jgi:hypothetical protein